MTSVLMTFDVRMFLSADILVVIAYIVKVNKNNEHNIEFTCDKCTLLPGVQLCKTFTKLWSA
jgi:hypothetical protein